MALTSEWTCHDKLDDSELSFVDSWQAFLVAGHPLGASAHDTDLPADTAAPGDPWPCPLDDYAADPFANPFIDPFTDPLAYPDPFLFCSVNDVLSNVPGADGDLADTRLMPLTPVPTPTPAPTVTSTVTPTSTPMRRRQPRKSSTELATKPIPAREQIIARRRARAPQALEPGRKPRGRKATMADT